MTAPLFTYADAIAAGWTFNPATGVAYKDDVEQFQISSGVPMFSFVREVAAREGQPIDVFVTPETVAEVSGETYEEPLASEPPPEPEPEPDPSATPAEVLAGLRDALDAVDPNTVDARSLLAAILDAL